MRWAWFLVAALLVVILIPSTVASQSVARYETREPRPTRTPRPTHTPRPTRTPLLTSTTTPSPTVTGTPTTNPTETPTSTPTSTATSTATATLTATAQSTPTMTATTVPTATSTVAITPTSTVTTRLFGVNYSGAEFGQPFTSTRVLNRDYIYPDQPARPYYFAGKGLRLVRLPISWELIQHEAFGPLTPADLAGIRAVLDAAQPAGQVVIVELHNFGRYYDVPLSVADSPKFADVWQRLATEFHGHPALYGYELMNEPHDLPEGGPGWAALAQAATDGIRRADTAAVVLVPGYGWSTARFWPENNLTLDVRDPAGRLQYAAHQYFDADYSGAYNRAYDADGAYPTIGVDRVQPFLDWLHLRNARGMLSEYGVPGDDPRWLVVLDRFLAAITADPNITGGTYWSAGPWWGPYPLSVEPENGTDKPQMAVLARYAR